MRKNKAIFGLLGLTAVCVGLGAFNLTKPNVSASAVEGLSVNRLGDLEWNAVDGATSYKVSSSYGEFTVSENKANVGDAILRAAKDAVAQNAQATQASVEFTVTPYVDDVAGTANSFTYTFDDYIDYGFATTDFSQTQKNAQGTIVGNNEMVVPANGTAGVIGATYKNNLFTFGWSSNARLSTNMGQNSYFYFFGNEDKVEDTSGGYYSSTSYSEYAWAIRFARAKYAVYLDGNNVSAKYAHENSLYTEYGETITVPAQTEAIESYALTVGVFDTYTLSGDKKGETLYIYRELLDKQNQTKTFDFETSCFVDNATLADPNADGDTADAIDENDYENCSGFGVRSPSANYTYTLSSAEVTENEGVQPLVNLAKKSFSAGEEKTFYWYYNNLSDLAIANLQNVKARITFNGTTVEKSLEETNVAGTYKIGLTVAEEDYDKDIAISIALAGGKVDATCVYTAQQCMEDIMSDATAEYGITYILPQGVVNSPNNPQVYTTATAIDLVAPQTIPDGYLFKGWYDPADTLFEHKIEQIVGVVGEIELVAVIVQGYTVTLEIEGTTQTFAYYVGDNAVALSAPAIAGKTFKKWQIKNGNVYQDYTGTSITPTANTVLKAVYEDEVFQITYVAEGATHNNPATFMAGDNVVFTAPTKDGYFFAGWYTDSVFTQEIKNTANVAQNLTLYARFIKDTVGATANVAANTNRQLVPMPLLPEGFTCATKLFVKGSTQALELEEGVYYVFNEVGTVYTVEYTIMLPTGEAVVRTTELTVVSSGESAPTTDVEEEEEKNSPWLVIGLIAGAVVIAGAGVGVGVFLGMKKKKEE